MNGLTKICLQKIDAFMCIAPYLPRKIKQRLNAYRHNDDGAMVVLTLYFFFLFAIIAGLGLAVMRHEMARAKLNVVNDAADLACAGAPSGTSVAGLKGIVEDYFAKNNMSDNLNPIDIDGIGEDDIETSLNATKCSTSASLIMPTSLLQLSGVDTLIANASGAAEIATPKLEVSLVLDVSGSMQGSKMASLKVAAKEFVTTILDSGPAGDISISIVPFSMGVTPPDTVFTALNIDQPPGIGNSNCIALLGDEFSTTTINPATPYRQQIYTMLKGKGVPFDDSGQFWRDCYNDAYMKFLPYSMSETALHNKIDSLEARGNTSGHLGIKWGAALLDPAFQPVATALKATGEMNDALTDVPSNWTEPETLKIIVMMGDGENTSTYYFDDPNHLMDESIPESHDLADFRGAGSGLYKISRVDESDNPISPRYYIRKPNITDPTVGQYYDISSSTPAKHYLDGDWLTSTEFVALRGTLDGYDKKLNQSLQTPMTWEAAWGVMTPLYYSSVINDYTAYYDYAGQSVINGSIKNTRMRSACNAAKNNGVVIYTIGFQVPEGGTAETELVNCAQSVANYSPATTTNISDVFGAIASNVQNLRLTQ